MTADGLPHRAARTDALTRWHSAAILHVGGNLRRRCEHLGLRLQLVLRQHRALNAPRRSLLCLAQGFERHLRRRVAQVQHVLVARGVRQHPQRIGDRSTVNALPVHGFQELPGDRVARGIGRRVTVPGHGRNDRCRDFMAVGLAAQLRAVRLGRFA